MLVQAFLPVILNIMSFPLRGLHHLFNLGPSSPIVATHTSIAIVAPGFTMSGRASWTKLPTAFRDQFQIIVFQEWEKIQTTRSTKQQRSKSSYQIIALHTITSLASYVAILVCCFHHSCGGCSISRPRSQDLRNRAWKIIQGVESQTARL